MKVGILTVYSADYGAYFQAVALCRAIGELGHDCEIVNENLRYQLNTRLHLGWIASQYFPNCLNSALSKNITTFEKYLVIKNDIESTDPLISKSYSSYAVASDSYDCIVVGSDELWTFTNPTIRFTPAFFGIGLSCPCISYATSGASLWSSNPNRIDKRILHDIKQGIKNFSAISVRDIITRRWLFELTGMKAEIVLDPTLLHPFFVSKCRAGNSKFVLVYGEKFDPGFISRAQEYAQKVSLPLTSISWKHDWCDDHLKIQSVYDLQQAFSESTFCMASSLHGTIFSILHQKPFISVSTSERGEKVEALLQEFQLGHRLFNSEKPIHLHPPIDYRAVKEKICLRRNSSLAYLKMSLDSIGVK